MIQKVINTIKKYNLFQKGQKVIVGFSGGIDSVCLFHILNQLYEWELDLWLVYVNHGLRPLENTQEIDLVQKYSQQYNVKSKIININIPERLKEKPQSLQLLAREERYHALEAFQKEIAADKIALAHHRDDQAETVLYRIIRGTGLDGLSGIPANREGVVVRPLLGVDRNEIQQYVNRYHLEWVEDSSNQKLIYQRNKIRHSLIPLIESQYNPRFKNALIRLSDIASEQRDFMETLSQEHTEAITVKEETKVGLRLSQFLQLHPYIQLQVLKSVLGKLKPFYQLEFDKLWRLREKIKEENTLFRPVHIYKKVNVYYENEWLYFEEKGEDKSVPNLTSEPVEIRLPGTTYLTELTMVIETYEADPPQEWQGISTNEIYFTIPKSKLPMTVRFWKPGDAFRPLGGPGLQKIQDFFTNLKIPRRKRNLVPLLVTADDQIIWVMGYRLSEDFKIKDSTEKVWHMTIKYNH